MILASVARICHGFDGRDDGVIEIKEPCRLWRERERGGERGCEREIERERRREGERKKRER